MALHKKTVGFTVAGVAAGVAGFLAASGRRRAAEGAPAGRPDRDGGGRDGTRSRGSASSCGTAVSGNGL
ncbi:hypothetical protein [Streptomyces sp. NPDC031705]|uniref:hypothetical protein n=1 Tax=Streptomyces sp. NPDC031705 TaxID=3155729 RepID=UPI0033E9FCED